MIVARVLRHDVTEQGRFRGKVQSSSQGLSEGDPWCHGHPMVIPPDDHPFRPWKNTDQKAIVEINWPH